MRVGLRQADSFPQAKHEVLDAVVRLGSARVSQPGQRGGDTFEADHAFVIGHSDQQWAVGVTRPNNRVDLEHRASGFAFVDTNAVIDDSFEDRERANPHGRMLTDGRAN